MVGERGFAGLGGVVGVRRADEFEDVGLGFGWFLLGCWGYGLRVVLVAMAIWSPMVIVVVGVLVLWLWLLWWLRRREQSVQFRDPEYRPLFRLRQREVAQRSK